MPCGAVRRSRTPWRRRRQGVPLVPRPADLQDPDRCIETRIDSGNLRPLQLSRQRCAHLDFCILANKFEMPTASQARFSYTSSSSRAKARDYHDMIRVQMVRRFLALGGISVGLMLCPVAAQQSNQTEANKNWTPPKTSWGEPDLQGIWPLNHLIATPFQRPEKYGDRRLMTDEEFAAAQKNAQARNQEVRSPARSLRPIPAPR